MFGFKGASAKFLLVRAILCSLETSKKGIVQVTTVPLQSNSLAPVPVTATLTRCFNASCVAKGLHSTCINEASFETLEPSNRAAKMDSENGIFNFVQKYNPTTNKFEWGQEREDYDFHQEIARAAYADMLHDFDRNLKYEEALSKAIKKIHASGKKAVVLDIGTGTGLLSMMAVRHGAEVVYACEAFKPMAHCATKVIKRNGCTEKIKLFSKRSTELEVGPGKDMETRANILVTEVFDTELIGEGAIETFNHAHKHLLTDDAFVVPHAAEIYAMIVDCPTVDDWNALRDQQLGSGKQIRFPPSIADCSGAPSVHDLQLSRLDPKQFTPLSDPVKVFTFQYGGTVNDTPEYRSSTLNFKCVRSGTSSAIFTWWILHMDEEKEVIITMQPEWWTSEKMQAMPTWKDHWMQCAYYLPERTSLTQGYEYSLEAFHDEFSLWYYIKDAKTETWLDKPHKRLERPICTCGVHVSLSRSRIGMLNDKSRYSKFLKAMQTIITEDSICISISEGSMLPLLAASLGAKKVFIVEEQSHSARVMRLLIQYNGLSEVVRIINKPAEAVTKEDIENERVNVVLGEPYFSTSILPWHNLYFWYAKESLKWSFTEDVKIMPVKAVIKAIPVVFSDLHNIKSPVGIVKSCDARNGNPGYDIQDFDELVLKAAEMTDQVVDSQPLWEYASVAAGSEFTVASIDLLKSTNLDVFHPEITDEELMECPNGFAMWMDWILNEDNVIEDSPYVLNDNQLKKSLTWNFNTKQGVFFTGRKQIRSRRDVKIRFNVGIGDVQITYGEDLNEATVPH